MGELTDHEFNLDGWGPEKRVLEGPCGHCHHAVAFKEPEERACIAFTQTIRLDDDGEETETRTHYFTMGICPRPRCQEATIVYRLETVTEYQGSYSNRKLLKELVIFPATSLRPDLPEEVPSNLRDLYREAGTIENLSPNGSAFLARRILEQVLRDRFKKSKGKLWNLIDEFRAQSETPPALEQMMHDIREFGNIAGHPGQDQEGEWTNVDPVEASYTLDVISEVLEYLYVKPARREQMRERLNAKKRGESPPRQGAPRILVGGREAPRVLPDDDDIPF